MTKRMTGRPKQRRNQAMLKASDVCWLCGHPGSDSIDHKVPIVRGGTEHPSNLAPAHHTHPCPTCGIKCNRVKSDNMVAPIIRRSGALNR